MYFRVLQVTLNSKVISPSALEQCLKFIYCGSIDQDCLEIQVRAYFNFKQCRYCSTEMEF